MRIVIPLMTRPKKNSQQIFFNKTTGKRFITQSPQYKQFEKNCWTYLKPYAKNISIPINLKCTFYVGDRRKRDIVNLLNSIQDILVKYKVLEDDNYNIVKGVDGSRIIYEKGREETIIEITRLEE